MRVVVSTYPQKKLFEGDVEASSTVEDVIKQVTKGSSFDATGRRLIVEKNQNFHRIPLDDPVNTYYNGHMGELYCIMDSSVRYRLVTPPNPPTKGASNSNRPATAEMYAAGYENLLTMLEDRNVSGGLDHINRVNVMSLPRIELLKLYGDGNIESLTIPDLTPSAKGNTGSQIQNSRGQYVYVFFLHPDTPVLFSRQVANVKKLLEDRMNDVIQHHNQHNPDKKFTNEISLSDPDFVSKFRDTFELIIIHNNPAGKTEVDVGYGLYQPLPIQKLSFIVTKHIDQPLFKLLHPDTDRLEIRNMYAHNGRTLEDQKTMESYSFRDGVRLILV
jgi:hypothetical protein